MDIDNIGMYRSKRDQLGKRIDNANKAFHQFTKPGMTSESWGYNYWDNVINHLTREWRREINENIMGNGLTMDPSHRR